MRNRQSLISKHRMQLPAASNEAHIEIDASSALVAAAVDALGDLDSLVSGPCFRRPDALTPERINAYAFALMRLRDCACAAGLQRLMNACDALAVTVARLIDNHDEACRERCEALARFVVHAEQMIRMATERGHATARPLPAVRMAAASAAR